MEDLNPMHFNIEAFPENQLRIKDIMHKHVRNVSYYTERLVVVVGVVGYWRGVWVLLDEYLYPSSLEASSWACVIAAMVLISLHYCFRGFLKSRLMAMSSITITIYERIHVYILGFTSVAMWRGIWYLFDIYLLPGNSMYSAWITTIGGSIILLCLGRLSSILAAPSAYASEKNRGLVFLQYSVSSGREEKEKDSGAHGNVSVKNDRYEELSFLDMA